MPNVESRKVVFLGDLADRGPSSVQVLSSVISLVETRQANCVPGNHDIMLLRKLSGEDVSLKHGLVKTIKEVCQKGPEYVDRPKAFLENLPGHHSLDHGRLVVAHAGITEKLLDRYDAESYEFAVFGPTLGAADEYGKRVRYQWAADYVGDPLIVYGHTPVHEPRWQNRTVNIDTGCVYGGQLTCRRYPELQVLSVPAHAKYAKPRRPLQ